MLERSRFRRGSRGCGKPVQKKKRDKRVDTKTTSRQTEGGDWGGTEKGKRKRREKGKNVKGGRRNRQTWNGARGKGKRPKKGVRELADDLNFQEGAHITQDGGGSTER